MNVRATCTRAAAIHNYGDCFVYLKWSYSQFFHIFYWCLRNKGHQRSNYCCAIFIWKSVLLLSNFTYVVLMYCTLVPCASIINLMLFVLRMWAHKPGKLSCSFCYFEQCHWYVYGWVSTEGTSAQCMMTSSSGNIFRVTGPLCGEFTGPGDFPTQRTVTRSFDVFFDLWLNKRLSKQPWGGWFETPLWSLWRQCNVMNTCRKTVSSRTQYPINFQYITQTS